MDEVKLEIKGKKLTFEAYLTDSQVSATNMMYSRGIAADDFLKVAIVMDVCNILGLYEHSYPESQ